MAITLQFLGAAGTVTGSRHLLTVKGRRMLVDCGLFQGYKQLRLKNWAAFSPPASSIHALVLTHAHIDHSGYVPLLAKNGFTGPVHCTASTLELAKILLPDSGYLQEKDAERANRYGYAKHSPAEPLYTLAEAEACLAQFETQRFHDRFSICDGVDAYFRRAGHILGAATVEIRADGKRILFSGDLGRIGDKIMPPPEKVESADVLVLESTYGASTHSKVSAEDAIAAIVARTSARGGAVLAPAFAVGRAQALIYHLANLRRDGRLPHIPIYLDSPMAVSASDLLLNRSEDHLLTDADCQRLRDVVEYVATPEESKALNQNAMPKVIISASGMATGGRVLHHLKHYAPDPRNTIMFTGFQAGGTRGQAMIGGAGQIKIHGAYYPVNAEIEHLDMLSAHADQQEILQWLQGFTQPPRRVFIVHGEPAASDALRIAIAENLGWECEVPMMLDEFQL